MSFRTRRLHVKRCKICGGLGYITDETGLNIDKWCTCSREQKYLFDLKRAGLYKVYQEYTFDRFIENTEWRRDYKARVIKYANNPQGWFSFFGQSGIGKTHLLSALTIELVKQDKEVRYVSWFDLINKARANYNRLNENELDFLKKIEVLYIDDFLKAISLEEIASWQYDLAFDLIASRYNNNLITIISSEWNIQDFMTAGKKWHALIGRVVESSGGIDSDNLINAKYREGANYRIYK